MGGAKQKHKLEGTQRNSVEGCVPTHLGSDSRPKAEPPHMFDTFINAFVTPIKLSEFHSQNAIVRGKGRRP